MTKWEYLVVSDDETAYDVSKKNLDEYGADGWELVTVTPDTEQQYRAAYFKRPLQAASKKP